VLLQLRDAKPGLQDAGRWGFFGGHLEPGEGADAAFLREMDEELGWRPRHFERYRTVQLSRASGRVTSHAYAAHLDVPLDALTLGEGQAMQLFAPDALPPDIVPDARPVVDEFLGSYAYRRVSRSWRLMTTTGLIVDGEGRFLLQHRDHKPDIANPGMWGSFGGELEPYETPDAGFVRELREELAWAPARYELLRSATLDDQLVYIFTAALDVPLEKLTLGEGQGMALFAPDAMPADTVAPLRRLIEWYAAGDAYAALRASFDG
jgi:8-oxo-dGTP diphosphatase